MNIPKHYFDIVPLEERVCSDGSAIGWIPIIPIINYCNKNLIPFDLNINLLNLEGIELNEKNNLYNLIRYIKTIDNQDLSFPIIMSSNGMIIDGTHRITKAILNNIDIIKCYKLPKTIYELVNIDNLINLDENVIFDYWNNEDVSED